jgi:hypothetical protein
VGWDGKIAGGISIEGSMYEEYDQRHDQIHEIKRIR